MKRLIFPIAGFLLLLVLITYVSDYAWLRIRMARHQDPFETLVVNIVYLIPQKGNKAEYVPQAPEMQSCVRSLFPHLGEQPCWYLRRHTTQQVNF